MLTESDYGLKDGAGDCRDTQKCHVNRKKQIRPLWLTFLCVAISTDTFTDDLKDAVM